MQLLERADELQVLDGAFEEAGHGRGMVVLVAGEAGIAHWGSNTKHIEHRQIKLAGERKIQLSGEIERIDAQLDLAAPILAAYHEAVTPEGVPLARGRRWLRARPSEPGIFGDAAPSARRVATETDR